MLQCKAVWEHANSIWHWHRGSNLQKNWSLLCHQKIPEHVQSIITQQWKLKIETEHMRHIYADLPDPLYFFAERSAKYWYPGYRNLKIPKISSISTERPCFSTKFLHYKIFWYEKIRMKILGWAFVLKELIQEKFRVKNLVVFFKNFRKLQFLTSDDFYPGN